MQKVLEEQVIKDFYREYLRGRTPNPCIRCNQYIKFYTLLKKAISLDARFLATGHYARITKIYGGKLKKTRYLLKRAKDKTKDQSYFLYRLNQKQLRYILFPLGDYTKVQVRKLAGEFSLSVADKLDSQEICFLSNADYRGFLMHRLPQITKLQIAKGLKPGPIVNKEGNILGFHKGIAFYTIGQREGLGLAMGYPIYVTKIEPKKNTLIVGTKEDACKREFLTKNIHFALKPFKKKIALKVKIRYNHREALAEIIPFGSQIKVCFKKTQFAITPGQSAVFYDLDKVLGGGIIDRVIG
jgi:tRNA-specific 2-thiouridylase